MSKSPSIPTRREHLDGMTCLGHVSGYADNKQYWTDLSVWYREDDRRPFISVVERVTAPGVEMEDIFRCWACGSIDVALDKFDDTLLLRRLKESLPEDMDAFPDANTRMMLAAARKRGYRGNMDFLEAAIWLYPGILDVTTLAELLERDFTIPQNDSLFWMSGRSHPAGWSRAFITALRYFDRSSWRRETNNVD